MMKMKKIAAVLLTLTLLSGCSGNMANDEAVTTMGTTTEVVTSTVETTSNAETSEKKTAVPPWELTKPEGQTEETTTTVEKIVIPDIPNIDLNLVVTATAYSEYEACATLISTVYMDGGFLDGSTLSIYFQNNDNGNPEDSRVKGWGCYPSALVKRLSESMYGNSGLYDITGSEVEEFYLYIDKEIPVAVWVTENLAEPKLEMESEFGHKLYGPKEVVVLAGYTDDYVKVWSPIDESYKVYDRVLFEQRYTEMGSMALTVVKE